MTTSALTLLVTVLAALGVQDARREVHEVTVTIGSLSVRALCTDGPRDVLLLHDAATSADGWRAVLERLDEHIGACAYDRRGSGESRPPPPERGWYELLDELRHIHRALGFDRDYVLVGHGLGVRDRSAARGGRDAARGSRSRGHAAAIRGWDARRGVAGLGRGAPGA
ncbi:MAG: alpha/beta fold hydrolase [Longimicrobiales bacterium]